jgi:type VI protein secretion system component VasF
MASGCKQPTTEEIAVEASLWVLLLLFVLVFLVAILWIGMSTSEPRETFRW